MAKQHGKVGAIYTPAGFLKDTTISFSASPKKILDSGGRILTSGFADGQKIVVTGAANDENNTTWTADTGTAAGYIVTTGTPIAAAAGPLVTLVVAAPGTVGVGFFNWELDRKGAADDTTDFADAGVKSFLAGQAEWSLTCERFFDTTETSTSSPAAWLNVIKFIRFFTKYVASPSAPDPAYYYEGIAIMTNYKLGTPKDGIVKATMDFQGTGTVPTLITKTSAWS